VLSIIRERREKEGRISRKTILLQRLAWDGRRDEQGRRAQ